jgi:hypothetical protein
MGGERDDWARISRLPQVGNQAVAVHFGHLHIGHEEIDAVAAAQRILHELQRFDSVVGGHYLQAGLAKVKRHDPLNVGAILGDQHPAF